MKFKLFIWLLTISFLNVMGQTDVTYRYWYDDNDNDFTQGTLSSTKNMELDVSSLDIGLHSVTFQVQDSSGIWHASAMRNFYKIGIDDKIAVANVDYWFDENSSNVMTLNGINGTHAIDVSSLSNGMHFVTFVIKDTKGSLIDAKTALFYKIKENEIAEVGYLEYWFDDKQTNKKKLDGVSGLFDIDVSSLSDGVHHITFVLRGSKNEVLNSQHKFFYKSSKGSPFITKWKYSVNHSREYSTLYELNTPVDSLSIISMLPVETCPIRSSCFEFRIEDSIPTLYAKNDITFYFYDTDNNMSIYSSNFIDESVKEVLNVDEIKSITPGVTETMPRPAENTIQWYKFEAEMGDTIALKSNYATTIQVFSPSGENIYTALGSESVKMNGCYTWENGTYYVAIHDVTATRCTTLNLDFMHMDRYDVVDQDVNTVGDGGYNTITFYGNGFDDLYAVKLYNSSGDTINDVDINHISNNITSLTFNFKNARLGSYNALFLFTTENKNFERILTIEPATNIKLTTSVTYPTSHIRGSYATYNIKVTNNSNMTAYYVPLELKLEVDSIEAIQDIKFGGNIKSHRNIYDISTDSIDEDIVQIYNDVTASASDLYQFLIISDSIYNKESGISYVFLNVPPTSTKEITVSVKMANFTPITINAFISNEWVSMVKQTQLMVLSDKSKYKSFKDNMCCYKERIKCIADIALKPLIKAAIKSAIGAVASPATATVLAPAVDCATDVGGTLFEAAYDIWCSDGETAEEKFRNYLEGNAVSLGGTIMSDVAGCVMGYFNDALKGLRLERKLAIDAGDYVKAGKISSEILDLHDSCNSTLRNLYSNLSDIRSLINNFSCLKEFQKKIPDCPPTEPKGGKTSPISSYDPNDISGYVAESGSLYIGKRVDKVTYMIEFENDSAFATAPAHTILLSDTLDTNVFDVSTITPLKLQIGDKSYDFKTDFKGVATVDMRPDINAIAQVSMNVDNNGVLTWILESLDPMTVEPTTEIENGILPINNSNGKGMGFITFSVNLNKNLEDGTEVANMANIVFDTNEPIATPYWINETDYVDPISVIDTLECLNDSVINLKFQGFDERSGIWKYDLYYKPGIESDWFILAEGITESSYQLRVYDDISYGFCVVATDKAGNREVKEFNSEMNYLNGEITTGIETIDVNKVNIDDGILYDIMGRRVKNPTPGIYIRNGQKILIK